MSLEDLLQIGNSRNQDSSNLECEEALLYASRHGQTKVVKELIQAKKEGKLSFNVSCKGRSKSNMGWTALHLATYFGHKDTMVALIEGGADVNAVNNLGDTPLHKAAFIGREELVIALLEAEADVRVLNGEGKLARDVCKTLDIHRLLAAAELAGQRNTELRLLTAAKEGQLDLINALLSDPQPPNVNCVDEQGNTCLHCAAYRGHAHLAVILLQNGIDSTIRNHNGKLALELARDVRMREVLSVQPVRRLQRSAARFEGPLLRRSRFLGWKPLWAVLQRGVLVYYTSRAEAAIGGDSHGRRDRKYLDGAKTNPSPTDPAIFHVTFSDGDVHRLAVPRYDTSLKADIVAARQAWITAFTEHVAYSDHYLWAGGGVGGAVEAKESGETEPEADKPLGSMQDAITNAANCLALLESQLQECDTIVKALEKNVNVGTGLHQSAYMRFQHACESGQRTLSTLRHAAALVVQMRETDTNRLREEMEKNRVLEQALSALAYQHKELELSVAQQLSSSKTKSKKTHENENSYYDAYEGDSDDDTLVTAGLHSPLGALSPWENSPDATPRASPVDCVTPTGLERIAAYGRGEGAEVLSSVDSLHTALSPASSLGTLVSQDGHVYRNARSYGIHRPSSQWSL